jgi:hypothetical protein
MRVIAIKDAPFLPPREWHNLTQAYKVGDIFDVSKSYSDSNHHRTYMVIFNHHIGSYMEVNYENFISLDEYRDNQINELLSV